MERNAMSSRPKKSWLFRIEYPPELPISARVDEIVTAIQENQVLVLAGETGSGKTTQIPKMCLEAGLGIEAKIGCTQPRRVGQVVSWPCGASCTPEHLGVQPGYVRPR